MFSHVMPNLFRQPIGHAVCLAAELFVSDLYDEVLKQVQHDDQLLIHSFTNSPIKLCDPLLSPYMIFPIHQPVPGC